LNTAIFALGAETLNVGLGLAIAVGINRLASRRLASAVRSAYFLPFVMSTAVVAVLWGFLLQRDLGVVNWLLGRAGVSPVQWLTSSALAMPTIILIDVWKNVGFFVVIFLAGLQTIPPHLAEAARLDGAGDAGVFRHITIPMLTPTIFFAIVIALIGASQVFDSVYVLTGGGPGDATRTVVMYLYEQGFQAFHVGYASAIALILFAIVLVLTVIQIRVSRRWVVSR
jgi:multiple sugar transport system permease protein